MDIYHIYLRSQEDLQTAFLIKTGEHIVSLLERQAVPNNTTGMMLWSYSQYRGRIVVNSRISALSTYTASPAIRKC